MFALRRSIAPLLKVAQRPMLIKQTQMMLMPQFRMFATQQPIAAFTANQLQDNQGARRIKKQVGRGPGSGKGKTAGRGHKGQYARSGGTIPRGYEGGQTPMGKRFPKRGFRIRRFNSDAMLEKINLGKIAYFIEKGKLDPTQPITIKNLFDVGALNKITHGVHVLGRGASKIKAFGIPISLEVTNASDRVIRTIESTGGSITSEYRTELIMRHYLKPHKFGPHQAELKTPMPPQKILKKLEKLREKGIQVNYPTTPWFDNNKERLAKEKEDQAKRIANAQFAELLPSLPADRSKGVGKDKPRVQREQLYRKVKLQ